MTAVEFLISIKQKREIDSFDFDQALEMEKQQNEIPNEEIEKLRLEYFKENGIWSENREWFTKGAKWYREQLKQKK